MMELQVTMTLSDRLFKLLEDKLPNLGRRFEKALTKEAGAMVRKEVETSMSVQRASAEPEDADGEVQKPQIRVCKAEAGGNDVQEPQMQQAEQQEAGEAAAEEDLPEAKSVKKLGKADIRAIIHRTRQRFEGENYKDEAGSEAYQKYHKPLADVFKQIALVLGAEKPSKLPDDKIAAFEAECDALTLDEKGNIVSPSAPF